MSVFNRSKLGCIWNDAQHKVEKQGLRERRFEVDLSSNLDRLEQVVQQVAEVRITVLQACALSKAKAHTRGLTDPATTIDSIRDQVNSDVAELGISAAQARPGWEFAAPSR